MSCRPSIDNDYATTATTFVDFAVDRMLPSLDADTRHLNKAILLTFDLFDIVLFDTG